MAIAIEYFEDRRTFLFQDGERRTILSNYAHLMAEVEPAENVAAEARKHFGKYAARAGVPALSAKPASKRSASGRSSKRKSKAVDSKTAASKARVRSK